MANELKIRSIKVEIILIGSTFEGSENSSPVLSVESFSTQESLHIDVNLNQKLGLFANTCDVTIYGLQLQDCFDATKYNSSTNGTYRSIVKVYAGYVGEGVNIIYKGNIVYAGVDMNDKNRPFYISSVMAVAGAELTIPSLSINSKVTFKDVVSSILKNADPKTPQYKVRYAPNFSNIFINSVHLSGSVTQQIKKLCEDNSYFFFYHLDEIVISQIGNSDGKSTRTITGMIGYPTVQPLFIMVKTYFDSTFLPQDSVEVDTVYTPLCNLVGGTNKTMKQVRKMYIWQKRSVLKTNGEDWYSELMLDIVING